MKNIEVGNNNSIVYPSRYQFYFFNLHTLVSHMPFYLSIAKVFFLIKFQKYNTIIFEIYYYYYYYYILIYIITLPIAFLGSIA